MGGRIKRLRIFAGPNGSGKSTLYDYLVKTRAFNGYFHINPDVIDRDLPVAVNAGGWPVDFTEDEVFRFLNASPFQRMVSCSLREQITVKKRVIQARDGAAPGRSYLAAALADFLRNKMLASNSSFSYESVFSHPSRLGEMEAARAAGYKIYLYFIATTDPIINRQRVKSRAGSGGHDVPDGKIEERYYRVMQNCCRAFLLSDRVYFFDNSELNINGPYDFFAEKNGDRLFVARPQAAPQWFDEYLLKKLPAPSKGGTA